MATRENTQTTLTEVEIGEYTGKIPCCKVVDHDANGAPRKCGYSSIVVLRKGIRAKHYCKIHAKDTWLEMAGVEL